jgi:hypothetical protein
MKTNNQLIAEFMGMSLGHPDKNESRWSTNWFEKLTVDGGEFESGRRHEVLLFNHSWDWLMPVVEKIESTEDSDGYGNNVEIINTLCIIRDANYGDILIESEGVTKLEATYKAVVEFIERLQNQ